MGQATRSRPVLTLHYHLAVRFQEGPARNVLHGDQGFGQSAAVTTSSVATKKAGMVYETHLPQLLALEPPSYQDI